MSAFASGAEGGGDAAATGVIHVGELDAWDTGFDGCCSGCKEEGSFYEEG